MRQSAVRRHLPRLAFAIALLAAIPAYAAPPAAVDPATAGLADTLRLAIAQCWLPPAGDGGPRVIVTLDLVLNPDGSVAQPPQLTASSQATAPGDPRIQAAVQAAQRAIMTCAPYKLPAEKYSLWRDITITFDPRQMSQ